MAAREGTPLYLVCNRGVTVYHTLYNIAYVVDVRLFSPTSF